VIVLDNLRTSLDADRRGYNRMELDVELGLVELTLRVEQGPRGATVMLDSREIRALIAVLGTALRSEPG
jgi:hypothetical protein